MCPQFIFNLYNSIPKTKGTFETPGNEKGSYTLVTQKRITHLLTALVLLSSFLLFFSNWLVQQTPQHHAHTLLIKALDLN